MTTTTVGINLLWLRPGEVGGSEQSTVTTVRGLLDRQDDELQLELFVLPSFADTYPELVAGAPTNIARIDGRSRPRRILTETTWLPPRTRGLDVIHHAGGTVPSRLPWAAAVGPEGLSPAVILTLHDLQPLMTSTTHSWAKRWYLGRAVPRALDASSWVVVPSAYVRRTVLERFPGGRPDRLVVIPHAVPARPPGTSSATIVERYRLTGPVVLYAAITYPHKDHAVLLAAFERVLARHPDAVLVLPGGPGPAEGAVQAQIDASPLLSQQVRRLGRIPEADVAGLLHVADLVAVPSRYEGFGLPALEAMAAGVAIVAADATSLPEVVGEAGRLVPVGSVPAWAAAIEGLLADETERRRLGSVGREVAARHTPEANAAAFANVYREAAAER